MTYLTSSGYTFSEQHRIRKTGGGIGLFLKDRLRVQSKRGFNIFFDIMEALFVEIPSSVFRMDKNVIICILYRPPGTDLNEFNDLLEYNLDRIKKNHVIH